MSDEYLERLVGCELVGYVLTDLLGMGGMAAVYRGENRLNRSIVRAIKVVRPELSSKREFVKRFAEEAGALEGLEHKNVVRFYGAQQSPEGLLVMQLELLEGRTLADELTALSKRGERMAVSRGLDLLLQACRGVGAAHAKGLVHRDLKPDNLFVVRPKEAPRPGSEPGEEVVKVLDFGIARAVDEAERQTRATTKGVAPGTPAYMAPEVCKENVPTAAADVYALGLVLYEALAGEHPFLPRGRSRSSLQLMNAHVSEAIPPIERARGDVPRAVSKVLERALAKEPSKRFATASELAAALELAADLSGPVETPASEPPRPPPEPVRLVARKPVAPTVEALPPQVPARETPRTEPAWQDRQGRSSNLPPTEPANPVLRDPPPVAATPATSGPRLGPGVWAGGGGLAVAAVLGVALAVWRPWEDRSPLPAVFVTRDAGETAHAGASGGPGAETQREATRCPPGMVLVTAAGDAASAPSVFCMDRTEVTVVQYQACGECTAPPAAAQLDAEPSELVRWTALCNHLPAVARDRGMHPMNCVDWERASTYCRSARRSSMPDAEWRLPTEHEWRVASGRSAGRRFPWGDADPWAPRWRLDACDADCLVMGRRTGLGTDWTPLHDSSDGFEATAPVAWFPAGAALATGILDLEGNVKEWVSDPERDGRRLACGGSWIDSGLDVFSGSCVGQVPTDRAPDVGFRCVAVPPPP